VKKRGKENITDNSRKIGTRSREREKERSE